MHDTTERPHLVQQTFIRCSQDALRKALTRADRMAACHFSCQRAEGDAAEGDATRFLRADGSTMLTQRTTRIESLSPSEMTLEPYWADRAPSRVVFASRRRARCMLTTAHDALPEGQAGVREGRARWARSLKSWLETGVPRQMDG